MKITYVGTYPPRQCGIATFTNNLIKSVVVHSNDNNILKHANVVAMNNPGAEQEYDYPEEVKFTVRQEHQRDYINAAKYINLSDSQACIVNHEFGLFGGDDGVYVLSLLHRVEIPLIVIFHTVLEEPSFVQKNIVQEIGKVAKKIVVMSNKAVSLLKDVYDFSAEKIAVIEHGVPHYPGLSHEKTKQKYNFEGRKILLTFGFLSRNKGIETVINALSNVVDKHPELLYIVMGETHPNVLKDAGEEYRSYLNLLVKKHNLQKHVVFLNNFVAEDTLFEYLTACDIYVTPYLNVAQITSGTLSYAVGAGAAVLSTPYWHAEELLADQRGRLFDFRNPDQLADILNEILDDPQKIQELRKKAYDYGKKIRWPLIGDQYLSLISSIKEKKEVKKEAKKYIIDPSVIPKFNLDHIKRLTDDTGIVQHAKYGIPNLKEGYCLDDNARALLMALMSYRRNKDEYALECIRIYLSYIQYMQTENGYFRNFLSFSRMFLDEKGSEDSFGRTIWALGYLIHRSPNLSYREFAKELFEKSVAYFDKITGLRGIANIVIGISYYLKSFSSDERMMQKMKIMAKILVDAYKDNSTEDWQWFEPVLAYDNAILPLSLFHVVELVDDESIKDVAVATMKFLEKVTMDKGYLSPIGSDGWYPKGGKRAVFDQQAIDAMASVRLFFQVYKVTRDPACIEKMFTSYLWFLGENELRISLYDYETSGCCDGLERAGVNRNQGAESTLAYLISHLTVLNALEFEFEYEKQTMSEINIETHTQL
jgi:glycosyltransferase involved in cell wall biosynthesis